MRQKKHKLDFAKYNSTEIDYTVHVRKLTTAEPFAPGIATWFFKPLIVKFFGVETISTLLNDPPQAAEHRIQFLGASDTAGYCVDGTPKTNIIKTGVFGWKYEDCNSGYVSLVG